MRGGGGQGCRVPELMESARRWSGFVCPDCRFVFRVPRDHDGRGVVCPSCRRMLQIPTAEDTPPPLVAPLRRVVAEAAPESGEGETRTVKRRRRKGGRGQPAWEHGSDRRRSRGGETGLFRWWLIAGGVLLALVAGGAIYAMKGGGNATAPIAAGKAPTLEKSPAAEPEEVEAISRSQPELLAEAEPLVRKFLTATTVDELLPLVRNPDRTEPRMRERYPDGEIQPAGMSEFDTMGGMMLQGKFASVGVRTANYEDWQIVMADTPDGLKIDWESWADWSDISWKDFLAGKSQEAHVFRVTLIPVDYYNFAFSDDAKWQSYRLESADKEHSMYGYVQRDTVLAERIRPNADVKSLALMLALKFPENPQSANQVVIDELVADGWVEEGPKP